MRIAMITLAATLYMMSAAAQAPGGAPAASAPKGPPPTTFVVAPSGRVSAVLVGPATTANLDSFLKAARGGQGAGDG